MELKEYAEEFKRIYTSNIKREGSEQLLEFLCSENSDFFTAPASTKYHLSTEGGLLIHSKNVNDSIVSLGGVVMFFPLLVPIVFDSSLHSW